MTYNELLQELEEQRHKSLHAYLDSPHYFKYNNTMNPWFDKSLNALIASNFYSDLISTMEWIKEETNV